MQSTMQQRLTALLKGGMAFTLASTMMAPTAALAETGSSNSSGGRFSADASESQNAESSDSGSAVEGGDTSGLLDDASYGNEKVTIIVELEEADDGGLSVLGLLSGTQDTNRHAYFKNKIRDLAEDMASEENNSQLQVFSAEGDDASQAAGGASAEVDTTVDEVHDYYNVIDGFAVKAPASTLSEIKELDGVKNAFIEHVYSVPEDQGSESTTLATQADGSEVKNQASLDITQADEVAQKGDGQVIAIIDTGIDTDHDAFSGDLDDSKVALTEESAATARANMSAGANGAYISEKIPFAYDYADSDADVNPSISGLEHGTHVAGIAAANGGEIQGTAPNAQLAIMKVASDADGGIYDSALLAALDDVSATGASSVNLSIGADAGFSDEGDSTYTNAINKLEDKGITVNVAAGNSYSAGKYNTSGEGLPYTSDPDSSIVSTPATIAGSFAVASMNTDPVEVEDKGEGEGNYITASNGTKMQYWEAKNPDGDALANKFSALADGDYDVVWADACASQAPGDLGDYGVEDFYGFETTNKLEGKIVLVKGHSNPTGFSEISYARAVKVATANGAAGVIIYDPNLTKDQLADIRLGAGIDNTDDNYGSGWYDENSCATLFVSAEDGEALQAIASSDRKITKGAAAAESTDYITAADGSKLNYWEALNSDGTARANKFSALADGTYEVVWADSGRTSGSGNYYGDVDPNTPNSLDGKIALVYGHQDLFGYGSVIDYARSVKSMSDLGAEAVIIYDPNLSADDIKAVQLESGWDAEGACAAIFVSAEDGEALKAIAASERTITKSTAKKAQSAFTAADGSKIAYGDVLTSDGEQPAVKFSSLTDGNYDYVWCGIARTSGDYEGVDYDGDINGDWSQLKGKVALVQGNRWFLFEDNIYSYDRMVQSCIDNGAIGVIVFDDRYNEAGVAKFANDGSLSNGSTVPVVQVAYDDGVALKDATSKTITVKQGETTGGDSDAPKTKSMYQMSSYSSWGVTPDLKLKPEVAAPGGNVYSSVLNNQYAYYSGTSMATPQIAGIASLIHEYVNSDEKFENMSSTAKSQVVTQLLMSTATPMADVRDTSSYYTPRQQGAGIANAVAATTSDVYATVDGATDVSRPKADLGESATGQWSFTVTLHNLGSEAHSFTPDTAALSDTVADGLFQQQMKNWAGQGISISYSGSAYDASTGEVTVGAKGIANLTVTITCESEFAAFASENCPVGTFVDGFAMLKAVDEGVDLSVPFLGFYGDWSDANAFDADAGSDYHFTGSKIVDGIWGETLGVNPMAENDEDKAYRADRIVTSNSGFTDAPTTATTSTSLLRNVNNLTISMTGPEGEDEGSVSFDYVKKTFYNATYKTWVNAESLLSGGIGVFRPNAYDDTLEGKYVLTETATTAGPTPEQQSTSFDIWYDTTAPEITNVKYSDNNGDPTVTVTAKDNTYLAAIDFVSPEENGLTPYVKFYRVLTTDVEPVQDADGNKVYTVTAKVSDIKAAWDSKYGSDSQIANTVKAYAWDYGKLASPVATAVVNPVAATALTASVESATVAPGQSLQLSASVTPSDSTQTGLTWASSDESVATVSEDGTLTGVAEGSATITVAVKDNPEIKADVAVKVEAVSVEDGLVLSAAEVKSIKDGDPVQITALLADSLKDATLTWESSDGEVFAVEAGEDGTTASIKGGYQVGDATLTVTATLADGSTKTSTATIKNRTADYDDFIIDENHVLRGYKGSKTTIIIPNDVTEIGEAAFRGDMQITRVGVPASVEKIGVSAFEPIVYETSSTWSRVGAGKEFSFEDTEAHPSHLKEISERAFAEGGVEGTLVLPEGLTTIGKEAFDSCLALNSVYLPDSLREIPDNCFHRALISYVEMSDNVTSIGANAFSSCLFLTQVKLHHVAEGGAENGLPSHLATIGENAFSATYLGAEGVSDIVIPEGVTEIPQGLFSGDRYITSVTLSNNVASIGYSAFGGMWGLESFTMPDSVVSLGGNVFQDCEYLKEVTISRNLGEEQLQGNFTWCLKLEKVNVPGDALNYTSVDGVVYAKDMGTLVYVPSAKTGTLDVPEGVKTIASQAFESTSLENVNFPSTLETIQKNGFTKQLDVVDLGSNITNIAADAFRQNFYDDDSYNAGYTPAHLIVRGGVNGSYVDTKKASQQQTAYFGEGMTSLDFSQSGAPSVLVVPASLETLNLSGNAENAGAITVYASANSEGWNVAKAALEAIGADPSTQLKAYTPLSAKATLGGIPVAGQKVSVSAEATGGVDGAKQFKFVQYNTDGTQTVLQDWSDATSIEWAVPSDGTTLRVEVRDATYISALSNFGVNVPEVTSNVPVDAIAAAVGQPAQTLEVSATAEDGASLSYQWYRNGVAIEGATEAAYTPVPAEAGTDEYYCVVTAAKDGLTATTTSATATVITYAAAAEPTINSVLPAEQHATVGAGLLLSVDAQASDGGELSYQWYCDGEAIEGATAANYQPDTSVAGTHEYYAVVTNTLGVAGNSASVQTSTSKVTINENSDISSGISAQRIYGETRYSTMQAISSAGFEDNECKIAVLAAGSNFPDALSASSLAGAYGAPVLLTASDVLSAETKSELERLGVTDLYILGGESSVSAAIYEEIEEMGIKPVRVYGESRQDTSLAVFDTLADSGAAFDTVIIASGASYADALSISPYAYANTTPIVLVNGNGELTSAEVEAIVGNDSIKNVVIVGGTGSVSNNVVDQLNTSDENRFTFTRLGGASRYETSSLIAKWEIEQGMSAEVSAIATGQNFADALAGAALSGANSGILLLADDTNSVDAITALRANRATVKTLYVYGGANTVSDAVVRTCESVL